MIIVICFLIAKNVFTSVTEKKNTYNALMHLTFHRNKVLNFFCILRKISLTSKYFIFIINNNEGCNSPAYNCLLIYDVAQVNVNIADVSIFWQK